VDWPQAAFKAPSLRISPGKVQLQCVVPALGRECHRRCRKS
jgi:hypothetical protein